MSRTSSARSSSSSGAPISTALTARRRLARSGRLRLPTRRRLAAGHQQGQTCLARGVEQMEQCRLVRGCIGFIKRDAATPGKVRQAVQRSAVQQNRAHALGPNVNQMRLAVAGLAPEARRWLGQSGVRASQVSAAVLLRRMQKLSRDKALPRRKFQRKLVCGMHRASSHRRMRRRQARRQLLPVARRSQCDDAPDARRVATAGAQQTVGAACCADVFREVATPAILTGLHRPDRQHFAFVASRGIVPGFAVAAQLVLEGLLDPIDAQAQGAVRQRRFSAGVAR